MGFIGDALQNGVMGVLLTLDTIIYGLISSAFKIFMAIAGARLLSSDAYTEIANKIYIVVGVLMLFVLAYSILRAIIDPDKGLKEALGPKLIKGVVTAVIGLAIAPVLFNLMYQAQGLILEQDVLAKLFFRSGDSDTVVVGDTSVNPDHEIDTIGGAVTATNIWYAFFHPADGYNAADIEVSGGDYVGSIILSGLLCAASVVGAAVTTTVGLGFLLAGAAVLSCANLAGNISAEMAIDGNINLEQAYAAVASGETSFQIFCGFLKKYTEEGQIEYLFGVSTIAGAFSLYAFVSFSIDMGIRAAKLAYLQIIAPIPLIMQVLPGNDKRLGKYVKSVVSTFMEVFIRITVVYVVVYIICHLQDLFSSVGALWDNESLNGIEKALALAFLILGLIAFCKVAPGFLTDALGLEKGTMDGLGLKPSDFRKKLADGGVFNARAIAGGGIRSAVRNWNTAKEKRDKGEMNGKQQLFSALGGFGSGAVRAGMTALGPEKIDTWRKAGDAAERGAQAAEEARANRAERKDQHKAFVEARRKAYDDLQKAMVNYERMEVDFNSGLATQAQLDAAREAMEAAREKYEQAQQNALKTTAIGAVVDRNYDRVHAWAVGTVSTKGEEEAMKFGDAMDALKGKLRDEAYAKGNTARVLKQSYDTLKNEKISEYADGWDEQSANAEYRRRLSTVNSDLIAYNQALEDRDTLKRSGASAAQLAAAEAALSAAQATLAAHNFGSFNSESGKFDLIGDLKVDMAEARKARDKELEGLRIAMEAAADAWVQEESVNPGSKVAQTINNFVSENYEYINKHQNSQMVVGYEVDSNGELDYDRPIKETLADAITKGFGEAALSGKFNPQSTNPNFKHEKQFELVVSNDFEYGGVKYKTVSYKYDHNSKDYVPYVVDAQGKEIAVVGSTDYPIYKENEFFERVRESVTNGKIKKANSKTALAHASEKGKTSSSYTRGHDYADKIRRKQQVEDAKKGGK